MSVTDERELWQMSAGKSQQAPRALKFDSKKSPVHQLRPEHIEGAMRVFQWAEDNKYPRQENGDPNYLLGHGKRQLLAAMIRHCMEAMVGNDIDEESGEHHVSHAICGGMMLMSQLKAGTLKED